MSGSTETEWVTEPAPREPSAATGPVRLTRCRAWL